MSIAKKTNDHLYSQLIKLGDMMGDGEHNEPGGKWIEKEYAKILKALGIGPTRKCRTDLINKRMAERVKKVKCQLCSGDLKQTRSGSMRGKCLDCSSLFQLMTFEKKKAKEEIK